MVMRLDSPQPIFTFPDLKFIPDEVEDQPAAGIALVRHQHPSFVCFKSDSSSAEPDFQPSPTETRIWCRLTLQPI